jgi:hypothetical protein
MARASEEKARAAILHPNAKWMKKAQPLARDYVEKLVVRTAEEQAAYLYSYFHMRANMLTHQGAVLDPAALELWTKAGGMLEERRLAIAA